MVLLDGEAVDSVIIDPKKHKFVGTFRPPTPPNTYGAVLCSCGVILHSREQVFDHWSKGHMDRLMYVSLECL